MAPTPRLLVAARAGVDRLTAGDVDGFTRDIEALGRQLLQVPPGCAFDGDDVEQVSALASTLDHRQAPEALSALATIAAWHLDDGSVRRHATAWLARAAAMAQRCDLEADLEDLTAVAATVIELCAVLDVIDVAPADATAVLARAARGLRLLPGAETAACRIGVDAVRWRISTGLDVGGLAADLEASAAALQGCLDSGRVAVARDAAVNLLEAYELLGDAQRAQFARLRLLDGLLSEGLIPQAEPLFGAVREPVVHPDQPRHVALLRTRFLAARHRNADAIAAGVDLLPQLPPATPMGLQLRVLLADLYGQQCQWREADDVLAPLRANLAMPLPTMEPWTTQAADLLTRCARVAAELGDAPAVGSALVGLRTLAPASAMASVFASVVAAWRAGLEQDAPHRTDHLHDGVRKVDELITELGDHVDYIARQPVLAVRVGVAAQFCSSLAAEDRAAEAFVASEAGRGEFIRSAAAQRAGTTSTAGTAALLDLAQHRARARPDDERGRAAARLAARGTSVLRELPLAALVRFAPVQRRDAAADAALILDAVGSIGMGSWMAATVSVDESSFVVAATDGARTVVHRRPLPNPALVELLVSTFTRERGRGPEPASGQWRARATECLAALGPLLGQPLLAAAQALGTERVVLSAPGALTCVPLAAIAVGDGTLLIDRLDAITVVSSVSWAAELATRPAARRSAVAVGALDDATIPDASVEAQLVADTWERAGAEVVRMAPMSQAAIVESAARARVLHLAAHASWHPQHVATGGLNLADGGSLDSGELFAAIDVNGAELVVLSACDTASASLLGTGEAMNLAAMVAIGGARQVVASLWPVRDAATLLTMTELHRQLVAGRTVPEALFLAQRRVRNMTIDDVADELTSPTALSTLQRLRRRRTSGPPFAHVEAWAPFICTGPPAPITTGA